MRMHNYSHTSTHNVIAWISVISVMAAMFEKHKHNNDLKYIYISVIFREKSPKYSWYTLLTLKYINAYPLMYSSILIFDK